MRRSGDQALDQALAFHREPGDLAVVRHLDLPEDLQLVLRIAAGDSEATHLAAQLTDESPGALREAAIFYLQQLLFADEGDSYRVLGVNPDAADEQIKLHYRLLVRWLHPDRNSDEWESVFADRVNRAWQDLRTPTRRNAYDLVRSAEAPQSSKRIREGSLPPGRMLVATPLLSARTVRWLPTLVLSGFGLFAIVALGLLYKLQTPEQKSTGPLLASVPAETIRAESPAPTSDLTSAPTAAPTAATANELPATHASAAPASIAAPAETSFAMAQTTTAIPVQSPPAQPPQVAVVPRETAPQPVPDKSNASPVVAASVEKQPSRRTVVTPSVAAAPVPVSVARRASPSISNRTRVLQTAAQENISSNNAEPTFTGSRVAQNQHEDRSLIDDRIAASLVNRFSQAYANGDMERLMQLFTHDAQDGRGDRRAIAEDYRRLFEASERRRIALSEMSWLTLGDGATIIASFKTEVVPRGKTRGEHASGDIRFDLREEDGELRIYRLSHDNRRS